MNKIGRDEGLGVIEWAEWKFVFQFAAVVMLAAVLPQILGYLFLKDGMYSTFTHWSVNDTMYHLAFARQVEDGALLLSPNHFGHASGPSVLPNALFLILGLVTSATELPLVLVFHLLRSLAALMMVVATYFFIAQAVRGVWWRRFCLIAGTVGAGFGWLVLLQGGFEALCNPPWGDGSNKLFSIDTFCMEVTGFWSARYEVVVPPAKTLLLLILALLLRLYRAPCMRTGALIGVLGVLLGLVHPHDLAVTYYVALAVVWASSLGGPIDAPQVRKLWQSLGLAALIPTGVLAYMAAVSLSNRAVGAHLSQQDPFTLGSLANGYGLLLYLAVPALVIVRAGTLGLLGRFTIVLFALLFVPVPLLRQVYLLHPMDVLLAVFCTVTLQSFLKCDAAVPRGWRSLAPATFLLAVSATNLWIYTTDLAMNVQSPFPQFLNEQQVALLDRLDEMAEPGSLVLAPDLMSPVVLYWTGSRTPIGNRGRPRLFRMTPGSRRYYRNLGYQYILVIRDALSVPMPALIDWLLEDESIHIVERNPSGALLEISPRSS